MKITEKLKIKSMNNAGADGITIAFLGDSVTQGCFELYRKADGSFDTIFDSEHAYHKYFKSILATLYPSVPVNIINAGISGTTARASLNRLERDVISHNPDLVVVCFGLNDACGESLEDYTTSLDKIFKGLKEKGIECLFMTPNMMSTYMNQYLVDEYFHEITKSCTEVQTSGKMDKYMDAARRVCRDNDIKVCDCYERWKILNKCGVDTTELLANRVNHPTRDMNRLFAYSLIECIFDII